MTPEEIGAAAKRASSEMLVRINRAVDVASRYWPAWPDQPVTCLAVIAAQRVTVQVELIAGGALGPLAPPRT